MTSLKIPRLFPTHLILALLKSGQILVHFLNFLAWLGVRLIGFTDHNPDYDRFWYGDRARIAEILGNLG